MCPARRSSIWSLSIWTTILKNTYLRTSTPSHPTKSSYSCTSLSTVSTTATREGLFTAISSLRICWWIGLAILKLLILDSLELSAFRLRLSLMRFRLCGTEPLRCCLARNSTVLVLISGQSVVFLPSWSRRSRCSMATLKSIRFSKYSSSMALPLPMTGATSINSPISSPPSLNSKASTHKLTSRISIDKA